MADLNDERLEELTKWAGGYGMPDVSQLLGELQRHRTTLARLEAWAVQLEGHSEPGNVGPFIAAELRNRIKGSV